MEQRIGTTERVQRYWGNTMETLAPSTELLQRIVAGAKACYKTKSAISEAMGYRENWLGRVLRPTDPERITLADTIRLARLMGYEISIVPMALPKEKEASLKS